MFAGLAAPLLTLALMLPPEGVTTVAELEALTSRPDFAWKELLCAETMQVSLAGLGLTLLLRRHVPFPPDVLSLQLRPPVAPRTDARGAAPPVLSEPAEWAGKGLMGAAAAVGVSVGLTALSYVLGLRDVSQGAPSSSLIEAASGGGALCVASLAFCTVILAPLFEETLFRGVLLASLTKWVNTPAAIAISSIIFAAVHGSGAGDSLQLFSVGCLAGVVYVQTRNLAAPICVHAIFNGGVLLLYTLWTAPSTG